MAEQSHIIVEAIAPIEKPMGTRNELNMRSAYPKSPIYTNALTDKERKDKFSSECLNGTIVGGHGINSYNLDYKGTTQNPVPNLEDVAVGGGGLPASPYIPNLTSPGPGSINASDQPIFNGTLPDAATNIEFGAGLGGLVSPSETSERISGQSLGSYISGKSYLGSDGQS